MKNADENIIQFYSNISDIYSDTQKTSRDKTFAFRVEMESFLKNYTQSTQSLHETLKSFYKIHQIKEVNDLSHVLKNRFNEVVHNKDVVPTEEDIKIFFSSLVRIVFIATHIYPPKRTINFLEIDQEHLLNELNKNQKLAILEDKRIVFVNAGAGTGKTHLLVNKIYYHIRQSEKVEKIVALSFTNAAARELQIRLSEKIFYGKFKNFNLYSGTIHSFAFKTLRDYGKSINSTEYDYIVLDEEESDFLADEIQSLLELPSSKKQILTIINGKWLNSDISPDLINKVAQIKEQHKLIGFEDMLLKFKEALQTNSDFIKWIEKNVTFLLIDEAQDLTQLNYEILDLLIQKTDIKMFLVGDPRQNIFGFNGGSYEHLNSFLKKNEKFYAEMILDQSYRCANEIFEQLNKFKFMDCENYPINSQRKGHFQVIQFPHKKNESIGIVELIHAYNDFPNTAVLAPALKYFDSLAYKLNKAKIPFVAKGGRIYLKKHIRLINHFLNFIQNPANQFSWKYILNQFKLKIEKSNEKGIENELYRAFQKKFENLNFSIDDIKKLFIVGEPSDKIAIIYQMFGDFIKKIYHYQYSEIAIENDIKELIGIAEINLTIGDFLSSFSLNKDIFKVFYERELNIDSKIEDPSRAVTLSTIHSAKGLEWKNVIIPGLYDGSFPNPYFCEQGTTPEAIQLNYNDDFKKLYVGMSRAIENLVLTYPTSYTYNYNKTQHVSKSRFLTKLEL